MKHLTTRRSVFMLLLPLAMLLASCEQSTADKLVGTWNESVNMPVNDGKATIEGNISYEKTSDDGGTFTGHYTAVLSGDSDGVLIKFTCEFSVEGTWRFCGGTADKSDPEEWKLIEDVNAPKNVVEETINPSTFTMTVVPGSIKIGDAQTGEYYSEAMLKYAGFSKEVLEQEMTKGIYEEFVKSGKKSYRFNVSFSADGDTMFYENEFGSHTAEKQ